MADHWQQTFLWAASMHVAVAPAHRPECGTEVSADGIQNIFAKREAPGSIADQWRKDVSFAQRLADGDTQRLLAFTQENSCGYLGCPVKVGHFFIQDPGEKHPTECLQVSIPYSCLRSVFINACYRLKHVTGYMPLLAGLCKSFFLNVLVGQGHKTGPGPNPGVQELF